MCLVGEGLEKVRSLSKGEGPEGVMRERELSCSERVSGCLDSRCAGDSSFLYFSELWMGNKSGANLGWPHRQGEIETAMPGTPCVPRDAARRPKQ